MNNYIENGDTIQVRLPSKITVQEADELREQLLDLPISDKITQIVLDASDLDYISSAGLRAIYSFSSSCPVPIRFIEVGSLVYDTLRMTGFTRLFKVERALRHIDVSGLKELGRGMYGTVYRIDDETVLKVFHGVNSKETLDHVLDNVREAFVKGIPTIIPFDIAKTSQGLGMVFELLRTECLADLIHRDPDQTDHFARIMADLAKTMANTEFEEGTIRYRNDMLKEELEDAAFLFTEEEMCELIHYIDMLPLRRTAVHGDFHARNIYMSCEKALLIDMDDFCLGHPIWDIACLYRVYPYLIELDQTTIWQIFGLDGSIPYPDFYYQVMHLTLDEGMALWKSFLDAYFEGYTQEEKDQIIDVVKFYSDFMVIRFLIDQCKKMKDDPGKMDDKLSLIHSLLSAMRKKDQDQLLRELDLWR